MALFSRYAKVIENDGTMMTVRSALARINEILDQVLNEQEGDFDASSRFAIAWYRQEDYDVLADDRVGTWEVLHHLIAFLERGGLPSAGEFLASAHARPDDAIDIELVKELAFLLFSIAEKNGWTQDALAFNTVGTAWPDIVQAARATRADTAQQSAFEFEEN